MLLDPELHTSTQYFHSVAPVFSVRSPVAGCGLVQFTLHTKRVHFTAYTSSLLAVLGHVYTPTAGGVRPALLPAARPGRPRWCGCSRRGCQCGAIFVAMPARGQGCSGGQVQWACLSVKSPRRLHVLARKARHGTFRNALKSGLS